MRLLWLTGDQIEALRQPQNTDTPFETENFEANQSQKIEADIDDEQSISIQKKVSLSLQG